MKIGISLLCRINNESLSAKIINPEIISKTFVVNYLIVYQKVRCSCFGGKARSNCFESVCCWVARFPERGDGRESALSTLRCAMDVFYCAFPPNAEVLSVNNVPAVVSERRISAASSASARLLKESRSSGDARLERSGRRCAPNRGCQRS